MPSAFVADLDRLCLGFASGQQVRIALPQVSKRIEGSVSILMRENHGDEAHLGGRSLAFGGDRGGLQRQHSLRAALFGFGSRLPRTRGDGQRGQRGGVVVTTMPWPPAPLSSS